MGGTPRGRTLAGGLLSTLPPSPHGLGPRSLLLQLGMTRGQEDAKPSSVGP